MTWPFGRIEHSIAALLSVVQRPLYRLSAPLHVSILLVSGEVAKHTSSSI